MFRILILICSIHLAPSDCQIETALDVVYGPTVANEVMCGLHGQAYIATSTLAPRGPEEYVKIKCLPTLIIEREMQRRQHAKASDQQSIESGP